MLRSEKTANESTHNWDQEGRLAPDGHCPNDVRRDEQPLADDKAPRRRDNLSLSSGPIEDDDWCMTPSELGDDIFRILPTADVHSSLMGNEIKNTAQWGRE